MDVCKQSTAHIYGHVLGSVGCLPLSAAALGAEDAL